MEKQQYKRGQHGCPRYGAKQAVSNLLTVSCTARVYSLLDTLGWPSSNMDESCTIPCSSLYANSAYCKQTFHMAKLVPNLLVGRTKKATIDFPKWSYFALAIQIIIVTCFANGSASICEHLNVDAFLSVGGSFFGILRSFLLNWRVLFFWWRPTLALVSGCQFYCNRTPFGCSSGSRQSGTARNE